MDDDERNQIYQSIPVDNQQPKEMALRSFLSLKEQVVVQHTTRQVSLENIPKNGVIERRNLKNYNSMVININSTLELLLRRTKELNEKMDLLLKENQSLKQELANLRGIKTRISPVVPEVTTRMSYSAATRNDNKILIVKKKGDGEKNIKIVKEELKKKVNPIEIGVGMEMVRTTKKGDLIITCGDENDIVNILSEIQNKLRQEYEVYRPKLRNRRIKVVGVNEVETKNTDKEMK
ncbi:hypothetical protein FQR65_LT15708 [Abscondita terminalis]|nr:hypothetical protein FQR65_LT15708 [Abscondita terminalis]